MVLPLHLVGEGVTKRNLVLKKEYFLLEIKLTAGILKIKDLNCGICIILRYLMVSPLEFFRYRTGLKKIYGNILNGKTSKLFHYILLKNVMLLI